MMTRTLLTVSLFALLTVALFGLACLALVLPWWGMPVVSVAGLAFGVAWVDMLFTVHKVPTC